MVINDFAHFRFLAGLQEFFLIVFNKIFDKKILGIRKTKIPQEKRKKSKKNFLPKFEMKNFRSNIQIEFLKMTKIEENKSVKKWKNIFSSPKLINRMKKSKKFWKKSSKNEKTRNSFMTNFYL